MKIVFIGDIVGRTGVEALSKFLPDIKEEFLPDIIIANAENASAGYGLTKKISEEITDLGVDIITLGNHSWDQKEMLSYIEESKNIIRPINYPRNVPGKGDIIFTTSKGKRILVIQVMLRLFMNIPLDDPFYIIEQRLKKDNHANYVKVIYGKVFG